MTFLGFNVTPAGIVYDPKTRAEFGKIPKDLLAALMANHVKFNEDFDTLHRYISLHAVLVLVLCFMNV